MESENTVTTPAAGAGAAPRFSCAGCLRSPPEVSLKRCARCLTTPYCSRDCQKEDWKTHKKTCGKPESDWAGSDGEPTSPPRGLDAPAAKPFTRLDNGTWLHDRPEKDVYRLLIDAYRLRIEDSYVHGIGAEGESVYTVSPHSIDGFRPFLDRAARRANLLPPWWAADKREACERMGTDRSDGNFHNLSISLEKSDVIERYGDPLFPMQLRMFAQAVYGDGPGGMNGNSMMKIMAAMEGGGGPGDMSASLFGVS